MGHQHPSAARLLGAKRPASGAAGAPAGKRAKQDEEGDEQDVLFVSVLSL